MLLSGNLIKYENNFHPTHKMFLVFNVTPDLTREGGSIPVTLSMQNATGKSVILLPIGSCDDGAHSQNEKIDRSNFINGVFGVFYLFILNFFSACCL